MSDESEPLDEDLYSRQIVALGRAAMRQMQAAHVLLCGVDAVGVEVAKNLVLAGVGQLTLCDPQPCALRDLAAHFAVAESDVAEGRSRANAALARLRALNAHVRVSECRAWPSDAAALAGVSVLVAAGVRSKRALLALGALARRCHTPLVLADAPGALGVVFADLGAAHRVADASGERPQELHVAAIARGADGAAHVTLVDDGARVALDDGDRVEFVGLRGAGAQLAALAAPQAVRVTGAHSVALPDVALATDFAHEPFSGVMRQVRAEIELAFLPLEQALAKPRFEELAGAVSRDRHMHAFYQALLAAYDDSADGAPPPGPTSGAALAERVLAAPAGDGGALEWDDASQSWLHTIATASGGVVASVTAFLGGVVAQEVLKACTHQYTPIRQWFYFDASDALPFDVTQVSDADFAVRDDDSASMRQQAGLVAACGRRAVERIAAVRPLVVGAGAIGCELLKNIALLGVRRARVIDMDSIERSNLNRQFLFRENHVGQLKSETAAAAVRDMRPALSVEPFSERVGPETEHVYNAAFYADVDVVLNALDNVEARLYMDSQCIFHQLPLFEGGTLGTKGNTQAVVPHLTESYGASQQMDASDTQTFPACTVHHFPTNVMHCLVWARDNYSLLFESMPRQAQLYIEHALQPAGNSGSGSGGVASEPSSQAMATDDDGDAAADDAQRRRVRAAPHALTLARQLLDSLALPARVGAAPDADTALRECCIWARLLARRYFEEHIAALLERYPVDHVTKEGEPFWRAPRRAPRVMPFDAGDTDYVAFVGAAAALRAQQCGWPVCTDVERVRAVAASIDAATLDAAAAASAAAKDGTIAIPSEDDIAEDKAEATAVDEDGDDAQLDAAMAALPTPSALSARSVSQRAVPFDKDAPNVFVDSAPRAKAPPTDGSAAIGSIEFVAAAANLRARAYGVEPVDLLEARRIAGGIVPALVTTTAAVAGWQTLELLKWAWRPADEPPRNGDAKALERARQRYKNGFMNLALPFFAQIEPVAPERNKLTDDESWTVWDAIKIDGPLTLNQLLDRFEDDYDIEVSMVSAGKAMLFAEFTAAHQARRKQTIEDIYRAVVLQGAPLPPTLDTIVLDVNGDREDDDEEIDLPPVHYRVARQQ